ncbi:MAG: tyrosine-type recombinase/integrase [Ruminococcus sp.]|nr:tyrosine-type recombinase/integrase [Ruminococcus sp.]
MAEKLQTNTLKRLKQDNPDFLNDFLRDIQIAKGRSERTVIEYSRDIKIFLEYILPDVPIKEFPISRLRDITLGDINNFIYHISDKCEVAARARKASSIRRFFKFLSREDIRILESDPSKGIEVARAKPPVPKYMTLEESRRMLEVTDTMNEEDYPFRLRDYCIITLFLNCGMRLAELIGINKSDIDYYNSTLRLLGKGNKERIIFLNEACIKSIKQYLTVRPEVANPALFLSNRKTRISRRRVQQIVENALKNAELDGRGLSTHKLRHTAATLMYQYSDADVLTLKEILGHAHTITTEIYTHIADQKLIDTMASNPLNDEHTNE